VSFWKICGSTARAQALRSEFIFPP
jgi:hypothetical protein